MKKILSTILIIAILISTGVFSIAAPQKAEAAAPGAKITWRQYSRGLRTYLLSKGVSRDMTRKIMAGVRDPNGDGSPGDAIWVYDTYGRRQ